MAFDFDAWIADATLARREVSAYKLDHRDEIARLTAEHDALPADADERESDTASPRHELAQRIAALRDEMEKSRTVWLLRQLTPDEFGALPDEDEDEPEETAAPKIFKQIALMSQPPKDCEDPSLYADLPNLTAAQWKRIANAIGIRQWGDIVADANGLVLSKTVVPDFSPTVSETLTPKASSES